MLVVTLIAKKIGARGHIYSVMLGATVLIASTSNPEFDAARALKAAGYSGKMGTQRAGRSQIDMVLNIVSAADRTVTEGNKLAPRFTKWAPHPGFKGETT